MSTIVKTSSLVKIYQDGTKALNGINLSVYAGEIWGFLGPNGAGKTTTIRILSGVLKPTSGQAWVFDLDVVKDSVAIHNRIGVLTENHGLYEWMTVEDNLRFFARFYSKDKHFIDNKINEMLNEFGLADRRQVKVGTLSLGLRKRVALIKTLIHEPELIFLDEPTSGLDPKSAREFRNYLKHLKNQKNMTVFLCTHNLPEAQELCDKIAIIDRGVIKKIGPPSELERELWGALTYKIIFSQDLKKDDILKAIPGEKERILILEPNSIHVHLQPDEEKQVIPGIIKAFVDSGIPILQVIKEHHSLEEIYLKLIGED
ncbi:MAG: ABC transporter ATP-binding protein [Promethearchaeota archaeon]